MVGSRNGVQLNSLQFFRHPRHAWNRDAAAKRNIKPEKNRPLVSGPTIAASCLVELLTEDA